MVMMLPFLTGTIATWFAVIGKRRACGVFWLITALIFAVWCRLPVQAPLALSF